MQQLVERFAEALKFIDASAVPFRNFQPGVGPYGEPQVVARALDYLRGRYPEEFRGAVTRRTPDVEVPGRWALEIKLVRPFGDNGKEAEHWSQNLLHPYAGNVSALSDLLKLRTVPLTQCVRRGLVVLTYSHTPARIDLEPLLTSFELISHNVLGIQLGPRCEAHARELIHPVHQTATVFGWELLP